MGAKIDLTGQKFGRLLVLSEADAIRAGKKNTRKLVWVCQCECGVVLNVLGESLASHNTVSCGCFRDELASVKQGKLVGQSFGRWTVLEKIGGKKGGGALWLCECDCGNRAPVLGNALRSGKSTSCGCRARDLRTVSLKGNTHARIGAKRAEQRAYLSCLKNAAKRRDLICSLLDEELLQIATQNCVYCGETPRRRTFAMQGNKQQASKRGLSFDQCYWDADSFYANGIDRVDSDKGYEEGNCVSCCKHCNRMKLDHTLEYWISHMKQVLEHQGFTVTKEKE